MNDINKKKTGKSPRKWRHLEGFKVQEDGKYSFSGGHMVCNMEPVKYRGVAIRLLILAAVSAAVLLLAGCVKNTGMEGNAFILVPYALTLVTCLLLCSSLFRMVKSGTLLRDYQYEQIIYGVSRRSVEVLLFGAAGLCGIIISVVRHTFTGRFPGAVILSGAFAVTTAACAYIINKNRSIRWQPEK
ncbi:MAG: hypothetical protein IJ123_05535 [Blautia sp.]|nr:hypothetical protein [Blautia sp.]